MSNCGISDRRARPRGCGSGTVCDWRWPCPLPAGTSVGAVLLCANSNLPLSRVSPNDEALALLPTLSGFEPVQLPALSIESNVERDKEATIAGCG